MIFLNNSFLFSTYYDFHVFSLFLKCQSAVRLWWVTEKQKFSFVFSQIKHVTVTPLQSLTIAGEGEWFSEVTTDDRDLYTDPQTLMKLLVTD